MSTDMTNEEYEEAYEFPAREILSRIKEALPASYTNQTGGGTATLYCHKVPGDIAVTAGPGSFHWGDPDGSVFYIGEFSAGMDMWKEPDEDGDDLRDGDEMGPEVPIGEMSGKTPEEFDRIAALIIEYHGIYNSGQYPK